MNLDVGMYVRTNKGKIGKIIDINLGMEQERYILDSSNVYMYEKEDILKASHNIIDLIEVGDIIITKHSGLGKEFVEIINSETSLEFLKSYFKEKSLDLVEVLTKEQFESMSYKVKE